MQDTFSHVCPPVRCCSRPSNKGQAGDTGPELLCPELHTHWVSVAEGTARHREPPGAFPLLRPVRQLWLWSVAHCRPLGHRQPLPSPPQMRAQLCQVQQGLQTGPWLLPGLLSPLPPHTVSSPPETLRGRHLKIPTRTLTGMCRTKECRTELQCKPWVYHCWFVAAISNDTVPGSGQLFKW